jgi:hypothetical protein
MKNTYTVSYTIYHPTDTNVKPIHKKYTFESEDDLLAAADEGMCAIYDKYDGDANATCVMFRSIVLENPQHAYKQLLEENAKYGTMKGNKS